MILNQVITNEIKYFVSKLLTGYTESYVFYSYTVMTKEQQ